MWGDYDNDGYEDLFLIKWGRPELFHNDGGHGFTRVSEQAGLPRWINANTAIWFDYDGDGLLDLFVGGYYSEDIDLWHLTTTRIMPESFEYAKNGGRKYLFHNLGNGKFEEVSEKVGINSRRWALAAAAADLRGTGHPDLFVANDYGVSELYFNDGKRFREVGEQTGVGFAPKSGMNAAFGDIFNQGRYAVYVSNISEDGMLIQGNNLWVPKEGTSGDAIKYENLARDFGVELGGWSFGAQFGDLNNDGTLDLYLTNGYISLDRNRSYWYDFSKVAGGNSTIIGDAKNWPAFEGRSLSGYQTQARLAERWRGQVCRCRPGGRRDGYLRRPRGGAGGLVEPRRARRGGRESKWTVAGLQKHGHARKRVDRIRAGRNHQQSQRDRRAGDAVLERAATSAGSFRRQRVLPRRISGGCISAWARIRRLRRP